MISIEDLKSKKLAELKEIAKVAGLKNIDKLKKQELINMLSGTNEPEQAENNK